MKTNSIFTRVLALVLCMIMVVGIMTACYQPSKNDEVVGGITEEGSTDDFITVIKPGTVTKPTVTDPNHIYAGSTELADNSLILGTLTNDVVIGDEEGIAALIPADVKVDVGATSLALSIKNVEDNGADFGDAEILNNLDVHISGVALDNKTPMTVKLGAILPIGLANTELKLYHHENGEAVLMTRVNSASDFAIHNQYVYNEETGEVTIYVASFSTFSMVKAEVDVLTAETAADTSWYTANTEADEFTLDSAADFIGFRNLVDAGTTFEGKTVKLGVDIDLNNINFDPIGYGYTYNKDSNTAFMGTFDGQGHTIYNLYEQGWDLESATGKDYTYSTAGAGLFASIENATIKNLVVNGADIKMECVDMGIVVGYAQGTCHFENIVVTNSKIANYQRATGGVVGEVCYGPYGTDISKGYSHTFKNIVVDSTVTVGSLWGDFDNLSGGVIGGKWGDATVKMEDVTVAVRLDVYSDVTAAYQWYAYRRCGMLIGHTEQNSPKSALNAAAPFLTCENVNVYYGDWVNYTYYQFANQESGTGRRYPWVRAEEGLNNGAFSNPRYGVPTHKDGEISVPVTSLTQEQLKEVATDYTPIVFNQLYGGGQGVYGCAEHDGVTTNSKNGKIIYVHNNAGWTNLKLQYWFANGNDTWTTIIDGIDMSTMLVEGNIYKIQLPSGAYAFKIVADGQESDTFVLETITGDVTLGGTSCTHTSTTIVEENIVNATCTANGSYDKVTKCAECGEEISRETITTEKLAHTHGEIVVENNVASSCTDKGSYDNVVYCTVCEVEISRETITVDEKGHTPGDAATCTTAQTCTVCSAVIKEALGHKEVTVAGKDATCTATGLTEGKKCSVCGVTTVAQTTIAAKGHTEVVDEAVTATCTTAGKTEGKHCSVCNTVLVAQTTVPAKGHKYDNACDTTCNTCGATRTVGEHQWFNTNYTCTVCGTKSPTKTIYVQNNWLWDDVRIYYYWADGTKYNDAWPGKAMELVGYDATNAIEYYKLEIPTYAETFVISGLYNDDNTKRDQTADLDFTKVATDTVYSCSSRGSGDNYHKVTMATKALSSCKYDDISNYMHIYLKPNSNWTQSNARFSAYVWANGVSAVWYNMSDKEADGSYSCWIPKDKYTSIIFCRMNPDRSGNNFTHSNDGGTLWNKTADLTIPTDGKNLFDIYSKASTWWDSMGNDCWTKK